MKKQPTIRAMHWFRKGLRLHDNPSLMNSVEMEPSQLFCVYVVDSDCYQLLNCTPLRANFLLESLRDLDKNLRSLGSRLYVLTGDPVQVLPVYWKKWQVTHLSLEDDETGEPYALERDRKIRKSAKSNGIDIFASPSETLNSLEAYVAKAGGYEKVPSTMTGFTKLFGKFKLAKPIEPPTKSQMDGFEDMAPGELGVPQKLTDLPWPRTVEKKMLDCVWNAGDCDNLTPIVRGGETAALQQLKRKTKMANWVAGFEKPKTSCTDVNQMSTTVLSPYMSLGCLSPRTFWWEVSNAFQRTKVSPTKPPVSLHGQLLWRDFNSLMARCANENEPGSWGKMQGNKYCRDIPWDDDEKLLEAWKKGKTGYPWIDACMAQLRNEGWIHHLGRHAVACFLTRGDLWQHWEKGALHFESHLLDADYALNGFNWMWLSCSGFFYQYFRCYSPVAFQQKNDKHGVYIRKHLPVLKSLPEKFIYEPWEAPESVLKKAGVVLGENYPYPVVEHKTISKSNMMRMKEAYDAHNDSQPPKKKKKQKTK